MSWRGTIRLIVRYRTLRLGNWVEQRGLDLQNWALRGLGR